MLPKNSHGFLLSVPSIDSLACANRLRFLFFPYSISKTNKQKKLLSCDFHSLTCIYEQWAAIKGHLARNSNWDDKNHSWDWREGQWPQSPSYCEHALQLVPRKQDFSENTDRGQGTLTGPEGWACIPAVLKTARWLTACVPVHRRHTPYVERSSQHCHWLCFLTFLNSSTLSISFDFHYQFTISISSIWKFKLSKNLVSSLNHMTKVHTLKCFICLKYLP